MSEARQSRTVLSAGRSILRQMMASVQGWVALVGGLATAIIGILKYFNYRTRTDRLTIVGQSFSETVNALAAADEIKRLAAAILLRRFFDPHTEQGSGRTPYQKEALRVIAALLRGTKEESEFQKLLADGLGHAPDLQGADLQGCNLSGAYLGDRLGKRLDLSGADLYQANLSRASLRGAIARETVFYGATLANTVLEGADLTSADFRNADLAQARFGDAILDGARFEGARNVPEDIAARLAAV
jgi:Pentapeptide repeats (8 copies)